MVQSSEIYEWATNKLQYDNVEFEEKHIDAKYTLSPLESTWNFLINYCVHKPEALQIKEAVHAYKISEKDNLRDDDIKHGLINEILGLNNNIAHYKKQTKQLMMKRSKHLSNSRKSGVSLNLKKDKYFSEKEKQFHIKNRNEQLAHCYSKMVSFNHELSQHVRYQEKCFKLTESTVLNDNTNIYERRIQANSIITTKQYDIDYVNDYVKNSLSNVQNDIVKLLNVHSLNLKNFFDKDDSSNKISKKLLFSKLIAKFVNNREAVLLRNEARKYAMQSITMLFGGMELIPADKEILHDYLEHFRLSKMKNFFHLHPHISHISPLRKKYLQLFNDFERKKSGIVSQFSDIVEDLFTLSHSDYNNIKFKAENTSMILKNLVELCDACAFKTEKFKESINKINILIQKTLNETLNRSQWNATLNQDENSKSRKAIISRFMIELDKIMYRSNSDIGVTNIKRMLDDSFSTTDFHAFFNQIIQIGSDCTKNYILAQSMYENINDDLIDPQNIKHMTRRPIEPYLPQFKRDIHSIENIITTTYSKIDKNLDNYRHDVESLSSKNTEIKEAIIDWWETPGYYCFQEL